MKKKYTRKQIQEAINHWSKKLNEGLTHDQAVEEAEIICDDIQDFASTAAELIAWSREHTLEKKLDYQGSNLRVVEMFIDEIEWEHGDIDDIDELPIAYEKYFKELVYSLKTKNISLLNKWFKSSVDEYYY